MLLVVCWLVAIIYIILFITEKYANTGEIDIVVLLAICNLMLVIIMGLLGVLYGW